MRKAPTRLNPTPLRIMIGVMKWRSLYHRLRAIFIAMLVALFMTPQWPEFGKEAYQIETIIGQKQFDFLIWEVEALSAKLQALLPGSYQLLTPEQQQTFVLDYLALLAESHQLEWEIEDIFTDPNIVSPNETTLALQQSLDSLRSEIEEHKPLAEAIVQDQVAAVLADTGFDLAGAAWPPVVMHTSPLPSVLIVSPRDRIERIYQYSLETGLPIPSRDEMETAVYDNLALSALVVPIGGLGTFPAMINETSSINWLVEVTVHEWAHHWMGFHPVGTNYLVDPQVRIINETAASIIDREIATEVIARYYPEFVLPPPAEIVEPMPDPDPLAPPPFDFQAEMGLTRVEVDRLLAEGKVEEAEQYMEERRAVFVENGYNIRKLNQAYFAFYGAYAAVPGGATGEDPVGPAVRRLRELSPNIHAFMSNIAPVDSLAELEAIIKSLE